MHTNVFVSLSVSLYRAPHPPPPPLLRKLESKLLCLPWQWSALWEEEELHCVHMCESEWVSVCLCWVRVCVFHPLQDGMSTHIKRHQKFLSYPSPCTRPGHSLANLGRCRSLPPTPGSSPAQHRIRRERWSSPRHGMLVIDTVSLVWPMVHNWQKPSTPQSCTHAATHAF